MSIKTPSTRQLENLREAYADSIDKKRKSLSEQIKELYPEPSNENLLNPIIGKIRNSLPVEATVEIDSYKFYQCKRKYKITFAVYIDPDEVKDPHADVRSRLYASADEEKSKKLKELENWYLSALLAATNKTDIPSFNPEYNISEEAVQV
jgi:hypothetical protein